MNIGVSIISGGLAGTVVNYFITHWKDRNIAVLSARVLPLLDNGKVCQEKVQCQIKFLLKRAYKPVCVIELFPKPYTGTELECFCRPGLNPEKTSKGSVLIRHVRKGDKVEIVFLLPRAAIHNDAEAETGLLDWSCSELIHVQKYRSFDFGN